MNYDYKRLFDILDKDFYNKIENKDVKNDHRLMVLFSGIPGSGKTTLAKKIEERYQGIRLTKDDARILIYQNEEIKDVQDVEDILDEYMKILMERLPKLSNGLLIMDLSVDRKFDKYKKWADKNEYQIFIIRFETSSETVLARWKKDKDGNTYKWFVEQLDRWTRDFENFREKHQPDFIWKENNESSLPDLYSKLNKILA